MTHSTFHKSSHHSHSLDSFRVLAIMTIFFVHISYINSGLKNEQVLYDTAICNIALFAVHFFIVQSAFLVGYIYEKNIAQGYRTYVWKRIKRLYPVNLATLPFYVVVFVIAGFYSAPIWQMMLDVFLAATLLQELFKFSATVFNTPAWTISTLFILYLITPLLIYPLQRIKKAWMFFLVIAAMTCLDIAFRDWLHNVKPDNWWLNYTSPVCRIFAYMEGLALGCAAKSITCPPKLRRYVVTMGEFLVIAAIAWGISLIKSDPHTSSDMLFCMTPILIAVFFMDEGFLSKTIGNRYLSGMSHYVYSFYISHYFFLLLTRVVCQKVLGIWGNLTISDGYILTGIIFCMTTIFSVILYHCVEQRAYVRRST